MSKIYIIIFTQLLVLNSIMWLDKQPAKELTPREKMELIDSETENEKNRLFSIILLEASTLNNDDLIYILENLLCHDLRKWVELIWKLWLSKEILLRCINTAKFSIKHPEFTRTLRGKIRRDDELKDNELAINYLKKTEGLPFETKKIYLSKNNWENPRFSFNKKFLSESNIDNVSDRAKKIVEEMNIIYWKYIQLLDEWHTYYPETISIDDRSQWIKDWEEKLFPMILRILKFYPKDLIETIYDNLPASNKDLEYTEKQKQVYEYLDDEQRYILEDWFVSFDDVQKILHVFVDKNLIEENDVDYIIKKLKYYRPLDTVLYAKVRSVEDENLKELKQLLETYYWANREQDILVEKNYETWEYEVKKAKKTIDKREETEISKKYKHIRFWEIVDWELYSETMNRGKNWMESRILKNWNEILTEYWDIRTCGCANWKIYHIATENGKAILFENWIRILSQYDNIAKHVIMDGNIYCVVENNWKQIFLKNNQEISGQYDEIKLCDCVYPEYSYSDEEKLSGLNMLKRYIWKRDGKRILLQDWKEVSEWYDKISYEATKNWNAYFIANNWRKKILLENGKKISWEYDEISVSWTDNWSIYYKARNDRQWYLVWNGEETPTQFNENYYNWYQFIYKQLGNDKYCFVFEPWKVFVAKNWEIISNIFEDYQYKWYETLDWDLYCCIDKHFDHVLLKNWKEILNWYKHIEFCESGGWHTYCAAENDDGRVLFRDWEPIFEWCKEIKFCEENDWNLYYIVTNSDNKKQIIKNWEAFTQEYDNFNHEYWRWLDWKLYSIAKKDWQRILLEDWEEITGKYDKLDCYGTLDWKIYHNAKKSSGIWVLLENWKEILEWYDTVYGFQKINWNIYCIWERWSDCVLLENWKEISKEYDRIDFHGIINWNIYYTVEDGKNSTLIENKIIYSDKLKLPPKIKNKLQFLNLCMSCGKIDVDNLAEIQWKITEYLNKKYNRNKHHDYSISSIINGLTKKLSYLFTNMIKERPEELIKTINPIENKDDDEYYANLFYKVLFKGWNVPSKEQAKEQSENSEVREAKWWAENSSWSDFERELADALERSLESVQTIKKPDNNWNTINDYRILWDVSMWTYNHINSLLNVYQYSWFDFEHAGREDIYEYLSREAKKLELEANEQNEYHITDWWRMLFDKIAEFIKKSRFESNQEWCSELNKIVDLIKDNLSDEEYDKLQVLINYFNSIE